MVQRDASKTSAFLARAETVLASQQQQRSHAEPLSPTRSHGVSCFAFRVRCIYGLTARIPDTLPSN